MGIMSAAVATTIGSVTSLAPFPEGKPDVCLHLIALPSAGMPSAYIVITDLAFAEVAPRQWQDVAWSALEASTERLYIL